MRILILGIGGMAGHILFNKFKENNSHEIFGAARERIFEDTFLFDAFNEDSVIAVLDKTKPDIVINAVGMLVKAANTNPPNAILINAYFPHLLSQLTRERNAYTIHLSTDCVFSGHKGNYLVNDAKDAEDFYGQTKALGELSNENDLTIRTSIIGPEIKNGGTGLLDWYLKSTEKISGYNSVFWSGVTTLELYNIIIKSINLNEKGLVQISNNQKISKYELLKLAGKHFIKNVDLITEQNSTKHDKSLVSSIAMERYSVPTYEQMIEALGQYMQTNKMTYIANYPQIYKD